MARKLTETEWGPTVTDNVSSEETDWIPMP